MKIKNGENPAIKKILQLLKLPVYEHDTVVASYQEKQKMLLDKMKQSGDIRERIKLQNVLLELDDAFLDYQSGMHGNNY